MSDHGYVALVRDGRIVFAIPLDEDGALAQWDRLQPPPWTWNLRPGDRVETRPAVAPVGRHARLIPHGYRIERQEELDRLRDPGSPDVIEVRFPVVEAQSGIVLTTPSARFDRRARAWCVHPGSSTTRIGADEARARAAALAMAADEVALRNAEED